MIVKVLNDFLAHLCETQFSQIGWTKPDGYFDRLLTRQATGDIVAFVAHASGQYMGHAMLSWHSETPHFREMGIPEINDLNVLPRFREQGTATQLIARCEELAITRGDIVGICVGLHPGYNNAQKLYPKLGYLIDGHGVHYNNKPIEMGKSYPFDDDLVLPFTKQLKRKS